MRGALQGWSAELCKLKKDSGSASSLDEVWAESTIWDNEESLEATQFAFRVGLVQLTAGTKEAVSTLPCGLLFLGLIFVGRQLRLYVEFGMAISCPCRTLRLRLQSQTWCFI